MAGSNALTLVPNATSELQQWAVRDGQTFDVTSRPINLVVRADGGEDQTLLLRVGCFLSHAASAPTRMAGRTLVVLPTAAQPAPVLLPPPLPRTQNVGKSRARQQSFLAAHDPACRGDGYAGRSASLSFAAPETDQMFFIAPQTLASEPNKWVDAWMSGWMRVGGCVGEVFGWLGAPEEHGSCWDLCASALSPCPRLCLQAARGSIVMPLRSSFFFLVQVVHHEEHLGEAGAHCALRGARVDCGAAREEEMEVSVWYAQRAGL